MNLASYIVQPKNIHFETQARREKIILLLRRHPVTQIPWVLFVFLITVTPIIGLPLLLEMAVLPSFVTFNMLLLVIFAWYLVTFGYAFMRFLLWFFNVNIITDQRIVDIDFPYLLYKESTATRLEQVEDITHRRGGFIRTVFDFGDVYVQTAGAEVNLEFLDIPRPSDVVRQIVELWQKKEPGKVKTFLNKHNA